MRFPIAAAAAAALVSPALAMPLREGNSTIESVVVVDVDSRAFSAPSFNFAATSTLSAAAVSEVATFAAYAAAAYCPGTATWSCGTACSRIPGVTVLASGGDGEAIPRWYVAYSSVQKAVIVANQGTNSQSILSIVQNLNIFPGVLDSKLFPGTASLGLQVHSGFRDTHAKTATAILAAVKAGMSKYSTSRVYTTGHSLGGALSVLNAVYLKLNLPSSATVINRAYGLPRIGNEAFANYVSSSLDHTRVTNHRDPVPHLPLLAMGFMHATGEQWISTNEGSPILSCPGVENFRCGLSQVLIEIGDHGGPYAGISMGSGACA